MTTRERATLLARAWPEALSKRALLALVRDQLGHPEVLDQWVMLGGTSRRARAPRLIYHVCAGNLAVSALTSLAHGLLLGSRNILKLPGVREDSATRREIIRLVERLPAALRQRVTLRTALDDREFSEADAIVAFGSDATMASLRARARWDQKFVAHGHAVSLLWLTTNAALTPAQARASARDILTYDQLGCLSPQAIYAAPGTDMKKLGDTLARTLESDWQRLEKKPPRGLGIAARIVEARDVAHARGHRVWRPPTAHLGWTVIHDPDPLFKPSPLHGTIYLRAVAEHKIEAALAPVAGRISCVGLVGNPASRLRQRFFTLRVSRLCAAGRMQFPPLSWSHDGRPALGDLVTWMDAESA